MLSSTLPAVALVLMSSSMPTPAAAASSSPAAQVLALANQQRAQAGLPPLLANPALQEVANQYAGVLAGGSCFAHTCGSMPDLAARDEQAGYTGWTELGENLAGGQRTPDQVIQDWMASPEHRANLLDPGFTDAGFGMAVGGEFGVTWTAEFGAADSGSAAVANVGSSE